MVPPQPPPYNENGEIIPHDYPDLIDNDQVLRRVSEKLIVPDKNTGRLRISSVAFKGSTYGTNGMSVDIPKFMEEAGIDAAAYVTSTNRWLGAICFEVGEVRELGFQVGYSPLPENPYHGEIWGNFTRANSLNLQKLAQWFVEIPDVSIR